MKDELIQIPCFSVHLQETKGDFVKITVEILPLDLLRE